MKGLSVPPPTVTEASVNGVSLTYLEQGRGAPVIFVHGATLDYRAWEGQRDAVSQRYRYIALTQRYFGTGAWLDGGEKYSLATHAADLATFIRDLTGGPTHIVGWSYGGAIALTLAVQHPELVKSLFVFEPGIATFVTDPVDAKAAAEDRQEMVTPQPPQARRATTLERFGSSRTG